MSLPLLSRRLVVGLPRAERLPTSRFSSFGPPACLGPTPPPSPLPPQTQPPLLPPPLPPPQPLPSPPPTLPPGPPRPKRSDLARSGGLRDANDCALVPSPADLGPSPPALALSRVARSVAWARTAADRFRSQPALEKAEEVRGGGIWRLMHASACTCSRSGWKVRPQWGHGSNLASSSICSWSRR